MCYIMWLSLILIHLYFIKFIFLLLIMKCVNFPNEFLEIFIILN